MEESTVFNESGAVDAMDMPVAEAVPADDGATTAESIAEPMTDTTDATVAEEAIDDEQLMADDLRELKSEFPELSALSDLAALPNAMRYAALRDLGLTATEAYLATAGKGRKRDNRSHLVTAVSRSAGAPRNTMSREELAIAKELFRDMSDTQIYDLYRRVKK